MKSLPLSLFEEYALHENRRAYPFWIFIRFRFRGVFVRKDLREAVDRAVGRHPFLTSVVSRRWTGRWWWRQVPGWQTVMTWVKGPLADGWPAAACVDLTREPGFRLVVVENAGESTTTDLVFQSHHALFDAAGAAAILQDILICYAQMHGQSVEHPEVREEVLPERAQWGLTFRDLPGQLLGLLVCLQLTLRKASPLIPFSAEPDDGPEPVRLPSVASRRFAAEEFRGIRDAAKRLGVGVNDLLVRDFQAAIGIWRTAHGNDNPEDWIRLAVPINLRRPCNRHLPAVNMISVISLDRQARSLGNRKRLLRRVCEDMDLVKKHKLGYAFLVMLRLCRLWPGGIRRYARRRAVQSSAMLSNLGQLFPRSPLHNAERRLEVPGAELIDVTMVGPCRPGMCASMEVALYGGVLMADMHYDNRVLTAPQAESLMQTFSDQIKLSVTSDK